MFILIMRIKHLRQADLNLLIVFTALAEERNVTRAAERLMLSQPAVSRALQRLRDMFHDDLLVRTSSGYEPTPKGERLLHELEATLPRLDRLLSGTDFDPVTEETSFQIAATDHATHALCPVLCRSVLALAGKVSLNFVPLHDGQFEAMEKGRLDLLLISDEDYAPAHFVKEAIFEVVLCVCSGEGEPPLARFNAEAVSCRGAHWHRHTGRSPDRPGEEIGRNRRQSPLPDLGALPHHSDAKPRRHNLSRDGAQAYGGIGGL
jgi:DNA-binding transcriptional LysR family regulator